LETAGKKQPFGPREAFSPHQQLLLAAVPGESNRPATPRARRASSRSVLGLRRSIRPGNRRRGNSQRSPTRNTGEHHFPAIFQPLAQSLKTAREARRICCRSGCCPDQRGVSFPTSPRAMQSHRCDSSIFHGLSFLLLQSSTSPRRRRLQTLRSQLGQNEVAALFLAA